MSTLVNKYVTKQLCQMSLDNITTNINRLDTCPQLQKVYIQQKLKATTIEELTRLVTHIKTCQLLLTAKDSNSR